MILSITRSNRKLDNGLRASSNLVHANFRVHFADKLLTEL